MFHHYLQLWISDEINKFSMIDLLVLQHHAGYASGSLIHAVAHSDNYPKPWGTECLRFIEIALCTPPRPHAPSDTACPSMGPCGVGRARCTLCLPRLLSGSALLTRRALSGSVWPCGVGGSVLALLRFRLLFLFLFHFFFFSFAHLRSLSVPTPSRYPVYCIASA